MSPPKAFAYPTRDRLWVGFVFVVVCILLSRSVVVVQAEQYQDDPPPSSSPSATETSTPTSLPASTPSPTETPEEAPTSTIGPPFTPSPSPTDSPVPTNLTPTPTLQASSTPTPHIQTTTPSPTAPESYPPGSILISEVAWAGTLASAHDEWIELYNPGGGAIDLSGWRLADNNDIDIALSIVIAPYSFSLLERTDDSTVASIPADQIYTGSLNNSGDSLFLYDPSGTIIDSANANGGAWPAGESGNRASMERRGGADQPGNWGTYTGFGGLGVDSHGGPIQGTPRGVNSIHLPPPSPTPEFSPSPQTATVVPSNTATLPASFSPGAVLINEVAWAGTTASASDEWIELFNPGESVLSLDGWMLSDEGDLTISLSGIIAPNGYFLLERSDDQTIADIPADLIYNGSLTNGGETLRLTDPHGTLIDSANIHGGPWPAGDHSAHASMERRGGEDHPGNWGTFTGYNGVGVDAAGYPIQGSPRQINSIFFPTPQPTWIPGKIVINEVLIRPHFDWEGRGGVDTGDEFVELLNLGPASVNLRGWILDDIEGSGSKPYTLPSKTIKPGEYLVFFRSRTRIALNDGGDTVRLLSPDGRIIDQVAYLRVRAYNLSYGRLPDGSGRLVYGLWPTPGKPNILFEEIPADEGLVRNMHCAQSSGFSFSLLRIARLPSLTSRYSSRGFRFCWPDS